MTNKATWLYVNQCPTREMKERAGKAEHHNEQHHCAKHRRLALACSSAQHTKKRQQPQQQPLCALPHCLPAAHNSTWPL